MPQLFRPINFAYGGDKEISIFEGGLSIIRVKPNQRIIFRGIAKESNVGEDVGVHGKLISKPGRDTPTTLVDEIRN